jgi:hypothetical protein
VVLDKNDSIRYTWSKEKIMLSNEEKALIADSVASFAMKMIMQTIDHNPEVMTAELDRFQAFICGALEAAIRDGRREALVTTLN